MANATNAFRGCWARCVSECSNRMSGEHYVTRGIWQSERVSVAGLPFLKPGERRELGLNSLVVNSLCTLHNSQLSNLDQALVDLVNAFRDIERERKIRARAKTRRHIRYSLTVDGIGIERCMLKTVINCSVVLRSGLEDWTPPSDLAEVVFGRRPLSDGVGLAILGRVGDRVNQSSEALSIEFGKRPTDKGPIAAVIEVREGIRFFCTWDQRVDVLSGMAVGDTVYIADEHSIWHPREINYNDRAKDLRLSLNFDWSGQWSQTAHPKVVQLRERYKSTAR